MSNYGGYSGSSLGTATALYDYSGQTSDDLSFYAGDVITVTAEDDGNGWLTGQLNGLSGQFKVPICVLVSRDISHFLNLRPSYLSYSHTSFSQGIFPASYVQRN